MRIQYFSDVHLEFGDCRFPRVDADTIIAAGDIAPLQLNPLEWLAQARKPVIYVAGNHEYYGGDLAYSLADLRRQASRYANVHFLERDTVELDGVRFIGACLWTGYKDGEAEFMNRLCQSMNDFRMIRLGGRELTPADILQAHHAALAWLRFELNKPYAGKTVVVTHHAPSLLSWPGSSDDPRMYAYCSSLTGLTRHYSIDLWIHGHTHTRCEYHDGGLRVACNARGYFGVEHRDDSLHTAIAEV